MDETRRARLLAILPGIAAAVLLIAPAASGVYRSTVVHDWQGSPRFDGARYIVSERRPVPQTEEDTGVAASLATLLVWQGGEVTEAQVATSLGEDFEGTLGSVRDAARELGLDGRWVEAERAALSRLKAPFLAHVRHDGGRFVVVRAARDGYVYATDPTVGQVLYRLDRFDRVWTGRALVFPEPPPQPQEWR